MSASLIAKMPGLIGRIVEVLHSRGWLPEVTTCPEKIRAALTAFQYWAGVAGDGNLDAETLAALDAPRFCALPDVLPLRTTPCKWPDNDVSFFVVDAFPSLTLAQTWAAFDWAFAQWAAACGLKPRHAESVSGARIVARVAPIDGPDGVLAESELPCGTRSVANQRYDRSEEWNKTVLAKLVILHELGHALGIGHLDRGNIMSACYDPTLTGLQAGDVAEIQERYGKPLAVAEKVEPAKAEPPKSFTQLGGSLAVDEGTRTVLITLPKGYTMKVIS